MTSFSLKYPVCSIHMTFSEVCKQVLFWLTVSHWLITSCMQGFEFRPHVISRFPDSCSVLYAAADIKWYISEDITFFQLFQYRGWYDCYQCEGISSKETVSIVLIIIKAHLLLKVSPVHSITYHSVFTKPFVRKY